MQKAEFSAKLIEASRTLAGKAGSLSFSEPVRYIYNPLFYARLPNEAYITRYGNTGKRVLFVGMNPGPWGKIQTGVPFGDVHMVRDWLGICEPVGQPDHLHPKRPVYGFSCKRGEVSGQRLWGLIKKRFGSPDEFFKEHFVSNYCPLAFFTEEGKNITPDKLPQASGKALLDICDEHLLAVINTLSPKWVIGVGRFAGKRIEAVVESLSREYGTAPQKAPLTASILHPSPASPIANRGWEEQVIDRLKEIKVW